MSCAILIVVVYSSPVFGFIHTTSVFDSCSCVSDFLFLRHFRCFLLSSFLFSIYRVSYCHLPSVLFPCSDASSSSLDACFMYSPCCSHTRCRPLRSVRMSASPAVFVFHIKVVLSLSTRSFQPERPISFLIFSAPSTVSLQLDIFLHNDKYLIVAVVFIMLTLGKFTTYHHLVPAPSGRMVIFLAQLANHWSFSIRKYSGQCSFSRYLPISPTCGSCRPLNVHRIARQFGTFNLIQVALTASFI